MKAALLFFILFSHQVHAASPLTEVNDKVFINGKFHSVSTVPNPKTRIDDIRFDGRLFKTTNSNFQFLQSLTYFGNTVTNVVLVRLVPKQWTWQKDTVINKSESKCKDASQYFFAISKEANVPIYRFYGNCF